MRRFIERALAKASKMTAEQLRELLASIAEENAHLDAALDSMLDGIIVCSLDHRPTIYNKAAERILRFFPGEISDRALWLSIPDREMATFFRTALSSEDTVIEQEFGLDQGSGQLRIVSVSITPLVFRKSIAGALIHIEDITEKRRREGQLRRAESLASLTTLAAGVAHEIKNPLGSMGIHMQLIKRSLGNRNPPDLAAVDRHIAVIDEEIARLNKIVVDFLFAVRPMDIQPLLTDIRGIVKEVAELVGYEAVQSAVELQLDLPESVPQLRIDRRYMKQALLNLVTNAVAAMPGGGRLCIAVSGDETGVKISISDTGIGIPEENLSKIFEPYFTTRENGTGLGLTITFKIIKEHGGDITLRSRQGQGTTFTITMPVPQRDRKLLSQTDCDSPACKD